MKLISAISICISLSLFSCQDQKRPSGSNTINNTITVDEFEKKLSESNAQLIDVRTPEEFKQGHLHNAINFDINSAEFENQLLKLDKNKPVLVYCLSGGRSGSASDFMANRGFKEIYNMQGGIIKWTGSNKPLDIGSGTAPISDGISIEEFNKLTISKKYVLVDYNAKWCEPCKKMAPMLEAFAQKRKDTLAFVKIDIEENKSLTRQKEIESIPVLELYKDGQLIWKHNGELDESRLVRETNL